jgi:hypothetical protein
MSTEREFIQNVRDSVAELYRDMQLEHGSFTDDWWTCKTRQCKEDIDRASRKNNAEAVCVIRGSVREKLVWARSKIGSSKYNSKEIREELDSIIHLIDSDEAADKASTASAARAAGAASTSAGSKVSEDGRDARMDALLERMRALIAEYARG